MAMIPQNSGMAAPLPNGMQGAKASYGGQSIEMTAETNQAALSAQAEAQVQARYVMAFRRPRSWDDVRVRILGECKRPSFAKAARYLKPIGKGVSGPSIRFAEACMRYAGNMSCDSIPVFEDRSKRVLLLTATDFETNSSFSATITVPKTVERKQAKDRLVLGQRQNSYGDTVYIVEATEDELLNTQNALVSKGARTLILRLIPGDIIEEGQDACVETLRSNDAKDPAAARKAISDAYSALGVMPSELVSYLGHPLEALAPAELADLRAVYATIRDGETTWAQVIDSKRGDRPEKPSAETQATNLADKVKTRGAKKVVEAAPAHDPETGEVIDAPKSEPKAEREPGEEG